LDIGIQLLDQAGDKTDKLLSFRGIAVKSCKLIKVRGKNFLNPGNEKISVYYP